MAIVKMNEITYIGLNRDRRAVLDMLTRAGALDIADISSTLSEEGYADIARAVPSADEVTAIERKFASLDETLKFCKKHDQSKKPMFFRRKDISEKDYDVIAEKETQLMALIGWKQEAEARISELTGELNRQENKIRALTPWRRLDAPLELTATDSVKILMASASGKIETGEILKYFEENIPLGDITAVNETEDQHYLYIVYHTSMTEGVGEFSRRYALNRISFKDTSGTAEQNISIAVKTADELRKELSKLQEELESTLMSAYDEFKLLYDYFLVEKEKLCALTHMLETESAFMLRGWIPAAKAEKAIAKLSAKFDCVAEIREPEKGEDYPILLKNNKFVEPFESITSMYSLPRAYEVDPNPFMAPFYFIAFGVMMGDAGYGILMMIASLLVLKVFKPEAGTAKFMRLIFWLGVSTLIFGAVFGSWMADVFTIFTGKPAPALLVPLEDPITFMFLAFAYGGIQILVGMGIKAYLLFKNGKGWDAVFDIFSWYLIVIGGLLMFLIPASKAGLIVLLSGVAIIVLFGGRDKKNPFLRVASGVLGLYDVTSYFSDVLSYSRMLALCLASGVIGSVINTLGSMGGVNNITGLLLFIPVLIVGHIFNMALSGLSAYVHTSRLQYIEFYGKFYEGGGKAYRPLSYRTKFNNVKIEEEL